LTTETRFYPGGPEINYFLYINI